jgi:hypothetical protein
MVVLPEIIAFATGAVMEIAMLSTTTETPADVVVPPGRRHRSQRVVGVTQLRGIKRQVKGALVDAVPTLVPSICNCTCVTSGLALTATPMLVPLTTAFASGDTIEIVGAAGGAGAFSIATTLPFRRIYSLAGVAGVSPWPNDATAPKHTYSQTPSKLWRTECPPNN